MRSQEVGDGNPVRDGEIGILLYSVTLPGNGLEGEAELPIRNQRRKKSCRRRGAPQFSGGHPGTRGQFGKSVLSWLTSGRAIKLTIPTTPKPGAAEDGAHHENGPGHQVKSRGDQTRPQPFGDPLLSLANKTIDRAIWN
jgi:hypothetical protein